VTTSKAGKAAATTPTVSEDPLSKPDGQFGWTDTLRAELADYLTQQRSLAQAQPWRAAVLAATSFDSLQAALYHCGDTFSAPAQLLVIDRYGEQALPMMSSHIRRSLSSFDIQKVLVRKSAHADLRKALPVWMQYRHDRVLGTLIRYPDDPFLLKYTEQLVLRWPVHAMRRILATAAPASAPLMSLVSRLLQQHPDWIEPLTAQGSLPPWLETALADTSSASSAAVVPDNPRDPRDDQAAAQAAANPMSAWPADVPELLRSPPWQRSKKPTPTEKLEQPWLKLPSKLPSLPVFVAPGRLEPTLLRESRQALPLPALEALLVMFMLSKPGAPYAGLPLVLPALDPVSLAVMGRDLQVQWKEAGCPNEERWILLAQAWTADAAALRKLIDDIADWPGDMAFPRAKFGLSVLTDMAAFQRSDAPLKALIRFAEKGKPSLRKPAHEQVRQAAQRMGLTPDELADRLIADLGLTSPGDHVFDFGARRFTLRFDDTLQPGLSDEHGQRFADLPKPNAKDNADLARGATQRWKALKAAARALASEQTARLEQALVSQRLWSATEFERLFQQHALLREMARRLLWSTTEQPPRSFRLSEEYSMLDAQDAPVVLGEGASVHLAHPMHLSAEALAAWAQSWADYELLQPFEQLGRRVHRLDDDNPATRDDVPSARGQPVAAGSLMGLLQRGWTRLQDGSSVYGLSCPCAGGGEATLHLQDAMDVSAPLSTPVLTIARLALGAQLTPLACSEVLRAVDRLARS
jgi:Domain of unknown function (DUF4132)